MSDRSSKLKPKENVFKQKNRKPNVTVSKKKNESQNNSYIPPHKRERKNYRTQFKKSYTEEKKIFIPAPSFKEKENDFPSLNDEVKVTTVDESTCKVSFANLVKNTEKPEIEERPVNVDLVKPGWIRWRKITKTGKWIEEHGPRSKQYKKFLRWLEDYKDYKKFIAFENYLDLLERRELEDLEINGPKYKYSWESDSEPEDEDEYDIEDDLSESEDSDQFEYMNENYYN